MSRLITFVEGTLSWFRAQNSWHIISTTPCPTYPRSIEDFAVLEPDLVLMVPITCTIYENEFRTKQSTALFDTTELATYATHHVFRVHEFARKW